MHGFLIFETATILYSHFYSMGIVWFLNNKLDFRSICKRKKLKKNNLGTTTTSSTPPGQTHWDFENAHLERVSPLLFSLWTHYTCCCCDCFECCFHVLMPLRLPTLSPPRLCLMLSSVASITSMQSLSLPFLLSLVLSGELGYQDWSFHSFIKVVKKLVLTILKSIILFEIY